MDYVNELRGLGAGRTKGLRRRPKESCQQAIAETAYSLTEGDYGRKRAGYPDRVMRLKAD